MNEQEISIYMEQKPEHYVGEAISITITYKPSVESQAQYIKEDIKEIVK